MTGGGAVERLAAQVGFVLEVDLLRSVLRRGYVADGSRYENSAERSWTLPLMAMVLAEHAAGPGDPAGRAPDRSLRTGDGGLRPGRPPPCRA